MKEKRTYTVDWAREGDDAELRRLLRETPMDGGIRLSLEREPSYFEAERREDSLYGRTVVARDLATGKLAAMSSRAVHEVFVNGRATRVGYLTQLRVAPEWRAHIRSLTRQGFEWLESTRRPDEAAFDFTTIMGGNKPASRLLTSGLPGFPVYREISQISTLFFPVRSGACGFEGNGGELAVVRGCDVEPGLLFDCLDRFARRHQFAKRWTPGGLRRCGLEGGDFLCVVGPGEGGGVRVRGCAALWDQRGFKQFVIRGYPEGAGEFMEGCEYLGVGLPEPGSAFAGVFLSQLAVDDDDPDVFRALLLAALRRCGDETDADWLMLGLAESHPLIEEARKMQPFELPSTLYVVHPPGVEVDLDGRAPHVEVACL